MIDHSKHYNDMTEEEQKEVLDFHMGIAVKKYGHEYPRSQILVAWDDMEEDYIVAFAGKPKGLC